MLAKNQADSNKDDLNSLLWLIPAYVFLVAMGTFSRIGLDAIAWLSVYALAAFYMTFKSPGLSTSFFAAWLVLLPAVIALLSVFWSVDPKHSFIKGGQLLYTVVIAVWLGASFTRKQLFLGLLCAMGFTIAASVANSIVEFIPAYSGHGELIGIFAQKNIMGRSIVIGSIALFVVGFRFGFPLVATLIALVLSVPLKMAESASSLIVYLVVLTMPVVYMVFVVRASVRSAILFAVAGLCLGVIGLLGVVDIDLVNQFLDKLGKDSSLTGRTVIWAVGWELFEWKPILGVGYDAFWSVDAFSNLMRTIQAQGEVINGFHNAYLESMVATGLVGGLAFIASLIMTLFLVIRNYFVDYSIESLGSMYIVVAILILGFFDIVMYREHDINHMLVVIMFVAAQRSYQVKEVEASA